MAEEIYIRLGDQAEQATLVMLNADGHIMQGPESVSLADAAARTGGGRVTALLPAGEIVCTQAAMPAASPSRLRQMLPFSLEDEFAADIEELHFAAGDRNEEGQLAVSVIARDRLNHWLGELRAAGISARRICSEADGVPDTAGSVTLLMDGSRTLGRRPGGAPFAFDGMDLATLWQVLGAEREEGEDLVNVVLFGDSATLASRHAEIDAWRDQIDHLNIRELADGCLPKLASHLVFNAGTNLVQGSFAPRASYGAVLRPWRAAAALLVAFVAFSVIGKAAELIKLGIEQDRLTAEATGICSADYGSTQLAQCLAEMGRRLASSGQSITGSGEGFLGTLATVANSLGDSTAVNGISFRDDVMTLELTVPNLSMLDAFSERVTQGERFAVDVQSTTTEADRRARVRVRVVALGP